MDVVDRQQERALVGVRAQQPPQAGGAPAVIPVGREVGEVRYWTEQLQHGGEGDPGVLRGAPRPQHAQAPARGVLNGTLQHGGTAGSGGSLEQDQAAGTGAGPLRLGRDQGPGAVAFTEWPGHPCLLW